MFQKIQILKSITLMLIILSGINSHSQDAPILRNGFEAGVYIGPELSTIEAFPKANNLKYSMYNGENLGAYISNQRGGFRVSVGLGLLLTNFKYEYTHPLYSNAKLEHKQGLLMLTNTYTFGFTVAKGQNYAVEIAPIVNITINLNNKTPQLENLYQPFFDTVLNQENNRLVGHSRSTVRDKKANASMGLAVTYQKYTQKSWFIRGSINLYSIDGEGTKENVTIYALNEDRDELIQKVELFHSRISYNLVFGYRLWHRDAKR